MISEHSNKKIPNYQEIDDVLFYLLKGMKTILSKNLVGLYLFGSLAYGDFNPDRSDIDLVAITYKPLNDSELDQIEQLHKRLDEYNQKWNDRLECSYTPIGMLSNILPPKESRPYCNSGIFYREAPYGNEWIINNHLLYEHSIPLMGPDFKTLIKPVDRVELQKACIRDLFQEWEPKMANDQWLDNSHYQSYLVLNLCRILYTVIKGITDTKKVSAKWVKNEFSSWRPLIETAEQWKYGEEMALKNKAIEFTQFAIDKIKQTKLYQEIIH